MSVLKLKKKRKREEKRYINSEREEREIHREKEANFLLAFFLFLMGLKCPKIRAEILPS